MTRLSNCSEAEQILQPCGAQKSERSIILKEIRNDDRHDQRHKGHLCYEKDQIMDRWTEYIDLFSEERDDNLMPINPDLWVNMGNGRDERIMLRPK